MLVVVLCQVYCVSLHTVWSSGGVAVSGLLCIPAHTLELDAGGVAVSSLLCTPAYSLELDAGGGAVSGLLCIPAHSLELWWCCCVRSTVYPCTQSGARCWWGCCVKSIGTSAHSLELDAGGGAVSGLLCIPVHSLELWWCCCVRFTVYPCTQSGARCWWGCCVKSTVYPCTQSGALVVLLCQVYCVSLHTVWSSGGVAVSGLLCIPAHCLELWWCCCVRSTVYPCTQSGALVVLLCQVYCVSLHTVWSSGGVAVSGLLCIPAHCLELDAGGVAVSSLLCTPAHSLELDAGGGAVSDLRCIPAHSPRSKVTHWLWFSRRQFSPTKWESW